MNPWKPKLVDPSKTKDRPPSAEQSVESDTAQDAAAQPESAWIDDRQLSFAVLLILTAGALYAAYIIFSPFLTAIFLAFVLAIAFSPLHDWIGRRIRGANSAALITTTVIMFVILVPFILISVKVISEAASFYSSRSQQWYSSFNAMPDALERAAQRTGIPLEQLKSGLAVRAQQFGAWLVDLARSAARGMVQQLFTALLTFLVLFFFLRDREEFRRGIFGILPLPPARVLELTSTVHECIISNIYGMFAVGLLQGILTAIGFWVTGLRAPLLWGVIAMVFSFVPLVGPSLVWLPGSFVLAIQGNWVQAIGLFFWGVVVINAADYVVRPRVAGGRVDTNRLLILLSFLGGVKAFGVIGIFVGPVVLALIIALLRILREEHAVRQGTRNLAA